MTDEDAGSTVADITLARTLAPGMAAAFEQMAKIPGAPKLVISMGAAWAHVIPAICADALRWHEAQAKKSTTAAPVGSMADLDDWLARHSGEPVTLTPALVGMLRNIAMAAGAQAQS